MKVLLIGPYINDAQKLGGIITYIQFVYKNLPFQPDYLYRSKSKRSLVYLFVSVIKLKKLLKNNYDVVHLNTTLNPTAILRDWFILQFLLRQNVVLQIHGGRYFTYKAPRLLNFFIERILQHKMVVVLSESEQEHIQTIYGQHAFVLPNAVKLPEKEFEINELNLPMEIVYLGRLDKNKGLDILYEALVKLKENNVNFKLSVYGNGAYGKEILPKFKAAFKSDFYYGGVVMGGEKEKAYIANQVFVLPSFFEGLPIALLEAMSYGRIVIATRVGSISKVIEDGKNGFLIEPKNTASLTNCLNSMSKQKDINKITQNAKLTIRQKYSETSFVTQLLYIYNKSLLKKSSPTRDFS